MKYTKAQESITKEVEELKAIGEGRSISVCTLALTSAVLAIANELSEIKEELKKHRNLKVRNSMGPLP